MSARTVQIDGEFWFTAAYAARLIATTRAKVEAMALRNLVRSRQDKNLILVAEADITRLRRDPKALAAAKEASRMAAYPQKSSPMPKTVLYRDAPIGSGEMNQRPVGNPLADEGKG